ncbi:TetR family transcriptional regulator [Breoghania corrubedonensis]|uniref:TetR family transcriptional regulator n=1 Tax=Breoghania corrubedonensis TaxID=665038 RepID=A0A2T5V9N0_9HYPH|nr:TetR/AcrR family transcriptional regulator [Breoghania corrubedonensis]PTW60469.1 TetR family transcriptional regulator [Breoghania corrubedonensis]
MKSDCLQRREILAAARDLFLTRGYGKTTTDDIAARCGISKRTLYRLYQSKIDLFAGIIETSRAQMFTLPDPGQILSATAALERMFRIDLSPEQETETEEILKIVCTEAERCPELREVVRQHGAEVALAELSGWLADRHQAREIVIDDPQACAQILMDMVFGTLVKTMPEHASIPRGHARALHIRRCVAIFLKGVSTKRA